MESPALFGWTPEIGRRVGESWELSVAGQNLLTLGHTEFPDFQQIDHTLDQRSIFGKIKLRF